MDSQGYKPGPLLLSFGSLECQIADQAFKAWIVNRGEQVVYSTPGSGGFEGEGQQLQLYDAVRGTRRKLQSERFVIEVVREISIHDNRFVLLVEMRDGGLGASHVAIVDPEHGQVFSASKTRVMKLEKNMLTLGFFHDEDWETLARGQVVQPYQTKSYDVGILLKKHTSSKRPARK